MDLENNFKTFCSSSFPKTFQYTHTHTHAKHRCITLLRRKRLRFFLLLHICCTSTSTVFAKKRKTGPRAPLAAVLVTRELSMCQLRTTIARIQPCARWGGRRKRKKLALAQGTERRTVPVCLWRFAPFRGWRRLRLDKRSGRSSTVASVRFCRDFGMLNRYTHTHREYRPRAGEEGLGE